MATNHYILSLEIENEESERAYLAELEDDIKEVLNKYPGFNITEPIGLELICQIFCPFYFDYSNSRQNISDSMEMLVKPDDKNILAEKVALKMSLLQNDKRLLIIDPYFFDGKGEVVDLIFNIFQKSNISLQELQIISRQNEGNKSKEISKNIKSFEERLKTIFPNIVFNSYKDDKFHDRFWIGLNSKTGVLMGTSLNGLAKRICIVESVCKDDVNDILSECKDIIKIES